MAVVFLNIDRTIETILHLSERIKERFPDSSLSKICNNLLDIAKDSKKNIKKINKPNYFFRLAFFILSFIAIFLFYTGLSGLHLNYEIKSISDFTQSAEATLNAFALLGASFYFLYKLEDYYKRSGVLKVFHQLRTIAHVIDMHQLTKDPSFIITKRLASSPVRNLSHGELYRYLDYCSEMLSLTSKVAVFYANENQDKVVLDSIHEIEILTTTLSRKIWQKISLIRIPENS